MDHPGEFTSEPFEFRHGGILTVQARPSPSSVCGGVEFRLEGSEDKTLWAELCSGAASVGEVVAVPCRDRVAPWGRVRIRALDADASVSVNVRRFREGNGRRARGPRKSSAKGSPCPASGRKHPARRDRA